MGREIILTGVKPTGEPHLGNYIGAIRPSLKMAQKSETSSYLFIADYHSLTSLSDPQEIQKLIRRVAVIWLACGLDPKKTIFYRQSDVPELFELNWILSCITPKGLMNRAHSYKAKLNQNKEANCKEMDNGVNVGLYSYPILMAADILLFSATKVPVGEDQTQHLEMTRDIAQKFNRIYKKELLTIPKALFQKEKIVLGLDGRKMSKSYQNYIPLFCDSDRLCKLVKKIKTDSSPPEEPKSVKDCLIFGMYKHFATMEEINELEKRYQKGIGWGEAKECLFQKLESFFKDKKDLYEYYKNNYSEVDRILQEGKEKARSVTIPFLKEIKKLIGIS